MVKLGPSIIILPVKINEYVMRMKTTETAEIYIQKYIFPIKKFKEELKKTHTQLQIMQILLETATGENWGHGVTGACTTVYTAMKGIRLFCFNYQLQPSVMHGAVTQLCCLVFLKTVLFFIIAKIHLNNS